MDNFEYKIINLAYMFTKFFLLTFWIYLSWVIIMGWEIKIMIGENGMKLGYEGIVPSVIKFINFLGGK